MPDPADQSKPERQDARAATRSDVPRRPARLSRHSRPKEIGGPDGPEPTRYGDWERNGRCTDF